MSLIAEALARKAAQAERVVDVTKLGDAKLRFQVWVNGPIYQYTGNIEVRIYETGIAVRDEYDSNFYWLDWWEMMHLADAMPMKLRDELQWERERAYNEGLEAAKVQIDVERKEELQRQLEAEVAGGIIKFGNKATHG